MYNIFNPFFIFSLYIHVSPVKIKQGEGGFSRDLINDIPPVAFHPSLNLGSSGIEREDCAIYLSYNNRQHMYLWKDQNKTIVNIISRAAYPNISKGFMYTSSKAYLSFLSIERLRRLALEAILLLI